MKRKKVIISLLILVFLLITSLLIVWFLFPGSGMIILLETSIVIDGDAHDADAALGMVMNEDGILYTTGYNTMPGQGTDIWLAKFD